MKKTTAAGQLAAAALALVATWTWPAASPAATEDLRTVRLGEQESCKITGVTAYEAKGGQSTIRFDVTKLGADAEVREARLCFWVYAGSPFSREYKTWGFARWTADREFDGFKVYTGTAAEGEPLDVKFPFHSSTAFLFEFDVTAGVRQWVKGAEANKGLAMNFTLPVAPSEADPQKQWLKPYLQVTVAGANADRPAQVKDVKAFCRSGQVFLTWKQTDQPVAFYDQTYRVYRSDRPITKDNLHQAERLGEVNRNSQLNVRRSQMCIGWGYSSAPDFYAGSLMLDGKLPMLDQTRFGSGVPAGYVEAMPKRFNFVIEADWAEKHPEKILTHVHPDRPEWTKAQKPTYRAWDGPGLSDDTGVFVHTVRKDGPAYFCVTAVVDGNENRTDVGAANSLTQPVACKVEAPKAVLQAVYNHAGPWGPAQMREYAYWEGGEGRLHNTPSTPICFTYGLPGGFVSAAGKDEPDRTGVGKTAWVQAGLSLAGYGNNYFQNSAGSGFVRMDTRYIPPTRNAPFPTAGVPGMWGWRDGYARYFHATRKAPDIPPGQPDGKGAWAAWQPSSAPNTVFGFVSTWDTGQDPRKATVEPYVENRALFEINSVLREFPELSRDRVVATGEWNGMSLAVHHADFFAAAACTMEGPWTAERLQGDRALLAGLPEWDLKTVGGHGVWKYNDLVWYSRQFPTRQWPFLSHLLSVNYDGAGSWNNMGYPGFYLDLQKEMRGGAWWWCDIGDAPATDFPAVARNEAHLVLTDATCGMAPRENWHEEPRGTMNGFVEWSRPGRPFFLPLDMSKVKNEQDRQPPEGRKYPYVDVPWKGRADHWTALPIEPTDEPDRFEAALHIRQEGRVLNGQSVPPCPVICGQVSITPQRLQGFKVEMGRKYLWRNLRVETGRLLQAGIVEPHELNGRVLLTVPGFFVDKDILGNRLAVTPADGVNPPKVDASQKVVIRHPDKTDWRKIVTAEMAYADYARDCREPEMVKIARSGRVFAPADFTNGGPQAGHYSMWGGGWDDAFYFPAAGRWRTEIRTDEAYFQNGAWPMYDFTVAGAHESTVRIATCAPATTYRWFDVSQPGRHRVGLRIINNTFHEPFKHGDSSGMVDRGATLGDVRFILVDDASAKPLVVRLAPTAAALAPGMPLKLSADVLDEAGRALAAKVQWDASEGANVSADGTFRAGKPGEYRVTAKAGEAGDSAVITVAGDAWADAFDDQWADGWRSAGTPSEPTLTARWWVMDLTPADGGRGDAATWYAPGSQWTDYEFTAEWAGSSRPAPRRGVLVRATDEKTGYRLEMAPSREQGKVAWRLVKVVSGKETELTAADSPPPAPIEMGGENALAHVMSQWEFVKADRAKRGPHWTEFEGKHDEAVKAADERSWKGLEDRQRSELAKAPLRIERWTVRVKGDAITCLVNGKEVLSATDADLKQGTVGFFGSGGGVRWDNVTVRPLK